MPLHESESIVLKTYNLAEADRIALFLTREFGIVRGVAKGARRLHSKFGSSLEPFSIVQLEYFQKDDRELVSIQKADLVISSFEAASDPRFLKVFSRFADLITVFAQPNLPSPLLYRMLRALILIAAERDSDLAAIELYFEVWLLRIEGFLPDWSVCARCGREFDAVEASELDAEDRLQCTRCSVKGRRPIAPGVRNTLLRILRVSPAEFLSEAESHREILRELSAIVFKMLSKAAGPNQAKATARANI